MKALLVPAKPLCHYISFELCRFSHSASNWYTFTTNKITLLILEFSDIVFLPWKGEVQWDCTSSHPGRGTEVQLAHAQQFNEDSVASSLPPTHKLLLGCWTCNNPTTDWQSLIHLFSAREQHFFVQLCLFSMKRCRGIWTGLCPVRKLYFLYMLRSIMEINVFGLFLQ